MVVFATTNILYEYVLINPVNLVNFTTVIQQQKLLRNLKTLFT